MTTSTISRNSVGRTLLRAAIPLAFWLGVWQLAALAVGKELLLPGPLAVGERLFALAGERAFWRSAGMSLGRIFGGFAAGVLLGCALAALSSVSQWADRLFSPAVKVIRATPVASFIVLVLLWAPTGRVPAIISALMVLPVLWGNVRRGITQTDPLLLEAARAYRFSRGRTLRLVYLPSVFPYFASGCSTGLGLAWKSGVAAEVLCQPALAIGTALYRAKITLETTSLFAWTIVVIALSFLLESVLGLLFRRLGRGARV
ncbi:ABC transporter permease [Lawsonibacter celer]|uniref:ABC transporter permease n=1 Tax=Lawsonibacter celer TaxID=2986526 RepID=UPI001645379F|nr:ABC transporter permease subunit [Lawsonibacter celer]